MLLIYLLNNSQQQWLLREMDRLLEKHPYAIDAFIVDFSSIMFAKTNGSTVGLNNPDAFDTFIAALFKTNRHEYPVVCYDKWI